MMLFYTRTDFETEKERAVRCIIDCYVERECLAYQRVNPPSSTSDILRTIHQLVLGDDEDGDRDLREVVTNIGAIALEYLLSYGVPEDRESEKPTARVRVDIPMEFRKHKQRKQKT